MIIFLKIVVITFSIVNQCSGYDISYYQSLINDGIEKATNYRFNTDASMYKPEDTSVKEFGVYDFVIIGAGTAGSVVASRISEMNYKVLVLEAGNFANEDGFEQFLRFAEPFQMYSDLNWGYVSVPQTTCCQGFIGHSCMEPRGKGVGGNTVISDAIYSRGHPVNYNVWSKITGDVTWSYHKILQLFKKSENFHKTNPRAEIMFPYHGNDGDLDVQHRVPDFFMTNAFIEANKELGLNLTDYNRPNQIGSSIFQYYTKKGKRQDFGTVYLKPYLNRPNLKVLTGSYVTKIIINPWSKVAEGVVFTHRGKVYKVKANMEVILSAGVIASPQILMLSGIGPKQHLQDLGISVVEDLEVGSTFRDQPFVDLRFDSNIKVPEETLEDQIRAYLKGEGTLTAPLQNQAVGFYTNSFTGTVPNLEVFTDVNDRSDVEMNLMRYKPEIYEALWSSNNTYLSFIIENLLPKSVGTIRLKNSNPFEYPLIDLKLLSDPQNEDIDILYQGIEFIFRLAETRTYQRYGLRYSAVLPPCKHLKYKSKEYWYCFIRQICQPAFHPVGTCPMGASRAKGAVVDSNLKVFGVKGLRVIDASVFPTQISGHPDIPTLMIAEKIAEKIRMEYFEQLPDEEVSSSF